MTSQRHQIQRQIFEISVADPETGQRLHDELSRLQREVIEPLLDKCCSELSSADRVHRIPRIEIDLGHISLENLQQEWVEKFEVALRETLTAKILEEEQISAMLGEDPAVAAQAELISLFARTGSVPFWVDSSSPGAVDEAVQRLLRRDVPLLSRLVLELSREPRAIRRLVRHVKPERLRALVQALLRAPPSIAADVAASVWEILALTSHRSSITPPIVWVAALETTLLGEVMDGAGHVGFFRDMLGRVALETGLAYASMVQDLLEQSRGRGVGTMLATLAAEVGRAVGSEKVPGSFGEGVFGEGDAPVVSILDAPGTPNSPPSAAQTAGSPPDSIENSSHPGLDKSKQVPGSFGEGGFGEGATSITGGMGGEASVVSWPKARGRSASEAPHREQSLSERASHAREESVEITGKPLQPKVQLQVPDTFGEGGFGEGATSSTGGMGGAATEAPHREQSLSERTSQAREESVEITGKPLQPTLGGGAEDAKPLGTPSVGKLERFRTSLDPVVRASQEVSNRSGGAPSVVSDGSRLSGAPKSRVAEVSKRLEAAHERAPSGLGARASRLHEEPDQIYLDAAGLVLLWPFFGTFFERLDLLADKKSFRDEGARARAVLMLHYVTTGEIEPPEYRLPLAKVLCGMPFDALFVPGDEITEKEMAEGMDLLSAVLEHAKIFGQVSADDFRAAFLVRRGILTTRDGSWLLRVEQAPYDMILQQLPWPLSWIRLPWMQIPVFVEWIR